MWTGEAACGHVGTWACGCVGETCGGKGIGTVLTEQERREIEAEFPNYATKQAVCVEALKVVQRHRGWVSDETLKDLSQLLDMTIDELDGVATFYNLIFRQPVGRHVILMCDSITCWILGYERLREQLSRRLGIQLGETTVDGRFTCLPIVCLGTCDHAPAMMIDNDTYRDLRPEQLDAILEKYK
jgi:NADH-quinone oxidoreductase subunit E